VFGVWFRFARLPICPFARLPVAKVIYRLSAASFGHLFRSAERHSLLIVKLSAFSCFTFHFSFIICVLDFG